MSLETATYLADLDESNPTATDPKSQGDDHIRTIKKALHNAFAGFVGQVIVTGTEAQGSTVNDYVVTVTADTSPTTMHNDMIIVAKATHTNTGTCTLGLNAITAVSLLGMNGETLPAGALTNGYMFVALYDSGSSTAYLLSPNDRASTGGDTVASLIVTGALTAGSLAVSGTATGVTPTAGDNTTKFATTEFVVGLGMSALLPGQTDKAGLLITTDGTTANWGIGPAALPLMAMGIV